MLKQRPLHVELLYSYSNQTFPVVFEDIILRILNKNTHLSGNNVMHR